mmetsp:Transcript_18292/g.29172  ORF Transcript_18292/g.29172 Transcript_18292/m.29172 type:complete len:213 (-) Transcript_18292:1399-2037(-)
MLPTHAVCAHRVFRRRGQVVTRRKQRVGNIGRIGWLGQVVRGPDLDCRDRRRNSPIAGQNNNPSLRPFGAQHLDHIKSVTIVKPQINHRISRRTGRRDGFTRGNGFGCFHLKPAFFHGLGQPAQKRFIIVQQQQRTVVAQLIQRSLSHQFLRFPTASFGRVWMNMARCVAVVKFFRVFSYFRQSKQHGLPWRPHLHRVEKTRQSRVGAGRDR